MPVVLHSSTAAEYPPEESHQLIIHCMVDTVLVLYCCTTTYYSTVLLYCTYDGVSVRPLSAHCTEHNRPPRRSQKRPPAPVIHGRIHPQKESDLGQGGCFGPGFPRRSTIRGTREGGITAFKHKPRGIFLLIVTRS